MSYKVKLEGSPDNQVFKFRNYDDALNFASMAVDNGTYQDYDYVKNEDGETVKVWHDPMPLEVRIKGVDD